MSSGWRFWFERYILRADAAGGGARLSKLGGPLGCENRQNEEAKSWVEESLARGCLPVDSALAATSRVL
jgi:hypothetical protein